MCTTRERFNKWILKRSEDIKHTTAEEMFDAFVEGCHVGGEEGFRNGYRRGKRETWSTVERFAKEKSQGGD